MFFAKYNYDTVYCPAETKTKVNGTALPGHAISILPNPATGSCAILSNTSFSAGSKADLYNVTGRLIGSYSLSGNTTQIPLGGFSSGYYLCRITTPVAPLSSKNWSLINSA